MCTALAHTSKNFALTVLNFSLVPAMATKTVNIPASIAAEVAATVGKIDADMTTHSESPLDKFGRLKAVVVGNP
jgi:hypothetical protein